jgi:HlyD family secretion protein
VPRGALFERGGLTGVFVAEDGRASFRMVNAAEAEGDSVEVLSGLSEGDRLVLSPPATLETGAMITEER